MKEDLEKRAEHWHSEVYGPRVNIGATYSKLVEEAGELGAALMAHYRGDLLPTYGRHHIREEIGDMAIVLMHLARGVGVGTLEEAIDYSLHKIENRLREGHIEQDPH